MFNLTFDDDDDFFIDDNYTETINIVVHDNHKEICHIYADNDKNLTYYLGILNIKSALVVKAERINFCNEKYELCTDLTSVLIPDSDFSWHILPLSNKTFHKLIIEEERLCTIYKNKVVANNGKGRLIMPLFTQKIQMRTKKINHYRTLKLNFITKDIGIILCIISKIYKIPFVDSVYYEPYYYPLENKLVFKRNIKPNIFS